MTLSTAVAIDLTHGDGLDLNRQVRIQGAEALECPKIDRQRLEHQNSGCAGQRHDTCHIAAIPPDVIADIPGIHSVGDSGGELDLVGARPNGLVRWQGDLEPQSRGGTRIDDVDEWLARQHTADQSPLESGNARYVLHPLPHTVRQIVDATLQELLHARGSHHQCSSWSTDNRRMT